MKEKADGFLVYAKMDKRALGCWLRLVSGMLGRWPEAGSQASNGLMTKPNQLNGFSSRGLLFVFPLRSKRRELGDGEKNL